MSGAAVMLVGAKFWMKAKTFLKTKKYENAMPTKNSSVLEITSGSTSFFSCVYRPGATKAQSWYSTTGSATRNAAIKVIFSGTMNGDSTLVAIIVVPLGSVAASGCASKSYSAAGPGQNIRTAAQTPTATSARISRSRSSIRCETKGCSVPASSSSWLLMQAQAEDRGGRKRATRAAADCALAGKP